MIWNKNKQGDTRVIKKFLWLPLKIGYEIRWLETVLLLQEFKECTFIRNHWETLQFMDNKK
jgi:hypothetical protein